MSRIAVVLGLGEADAAKVARPVSQEDVQSDMPGALDWLVECVQQVLWS